MRENLTIWLIGAVFVIVVGMGGVYLQAQTYTDKRVNEVKEDTSKKINGIKEDVSKQIDKIDGKLEITNERVQKILETIIKIDERTKRMNDGDRNRPR